VESDTADGATKVNDSATLAYMKSTFMDHYNNNRQPFGLYTHPIHVSVRFLVSLTRKPDPNSQIAHQLSVPGSTVTNSTISMINAFLDWAQMQPNGMSTSFFPSPLLLTPFTHSLDRVKRPTPRLGPQP
jgi:hypothetical protein